MRILIHQVLIIYNFRYVNIYVKVMITCMFKLNV